MKTDTNLLDAWFVTGFAERESTFTYSRSRRGLALYFGLQVRAEDAELLRKIRQFFAGAGTIYPRRGRKEGGGRPVTHAHYYRVTRIAELLRIVGHFDLHPFQGSKAASFEIWREMVLLKAGPETADRERLSLLAAELSARVPPGRVRAPR